MMVVYSTRFLPVDARQNDKPKLCNHNLGIENLIQGRQDQLQQNGAHKFFDDQRNSRVQKN